MTDSPLVAPALEDIALKVLWTKCGEDALCVGIDVPDGISPESYDGFRVSINDEPFADVVGSEHTFTGLAVNKRYTIHAEYSVGGDWVPFRNPLMTNLVKNDVPARLRAMARNGTMEKHRGGCKSENARNTAREITV